jgi:uncharacterized protein
MTHRRRQPVGPLSSKVNFMTSSTTSPGTALITGASTGIGAIYADRLARRGHDLILVARNGERLRALADELHAATGRRITTLVADLTDAAARSRVEEVLRTDESLTMLVNNAGIGSVASILADDADTMEHMIALNATA